MFELLLFNCVVFRATGEGGFWLYREVTKSYKKEDKYVDRVTIPVPVFRKMIVSIIMFLLSLNC